MRKSIAAALAVLTFGGAVASAAAPAQAQEYRRGFERSYGDYGHSHHRDGTSTAIIAGVAGLAIGAALASSSHHSGGGYSQGYYDQGYGSGYNNGYGGGYRSSYDDDDWSGASYGRPYGYSSGYGVCERNERSYDAYSGRQVTVRTRYPC
jgi:hypothetical protein